MTGPAAKRRLSPHPRDVDADKKVKRHWHNRGSKTSTHLSIEPGDAGIFATCPRNKENKCVSELRDLFHDYASHLYGDIQGIPDAEIGNDIQAEVSAEIQGMQKPEREPLFSSVHLDVPCVAFFKTRKPVDPVHLVRKICEDALTSGKPRTRFTLRLSPMAVMGHASEKGIDETAMKALAPHFYSPDVAVKRFAIRPSLRHNNPTMTRDIVIKRVAESVGDKHKVDLTNYDLCILVEVYKSICGIGVVAADYEKLKRYNLAEIYAPGSGAAQPVATTKPTT